ncbi:TonB-dependent receptor [Croceicoccus gelatinilyticus]|uniref:TonB-dependent receptor n=1 Tax=Croceicoccus gelatinilyticus TaxID=2835536 RepID=UPI001BCF9C39|nr:TonB-dependent receptor [Croceicoccus gelatinilyticus]MBS7669072.1 TonB-dependent receptor [Croceicoccus gelatinilyticus]
MIVTRYCKSLLLAGASASIALTGGTAFAQDGEAEVTTGNEIVVTARKTNESLYEVPLAVSAVTAEAMEKRGITSINDVASFTPSVNVNNNAASRNDRSAQQLIVRGFTPSAFTNPTASLFIDGVPVSSSSALSVISSPERIEVLKGPQTAYFGRNTFAGAINVVNGRPADYLTGSVGGTIGTRDYYRFHADIEGPLVGDWLLFKLSADHYEKSGSWKSELNPSETLGDQQSQSGTITLFAEPAPGLTFTAFGMLSKDKDGHSDQALVSAYEVLDGDGNVVLPGQSNCTLTGSGGVAVPFMCGTIGSGFYAANQPSANTTEDAFIQNFLANPTGRLIDPEDGVQGYGLVREFKHAHFVADWEIGDTGITLSSLTGYNDEFYSQLADIDNYGSTGLSNDAFGAVPAGARDYFDFPYLVERVYKDFSQEVRASYDDGGPFNGTVGLSYLNARGQGGLGGGNGGLGSTVFSSISGKTQNKTYGAFFGLSYDVTDALTISAEGRYQIDKLYAFAAPSGFNATSDVFVPAGFYEGGSLLLKETYKNFLPRLIVEYNVSPDLMVYASYSKGVNPGLFNTAFLNFTEEQRQAAADNGITIAVDPEKVTNYEVGFKGTVLNDMLSFALAAYYAPWRNQINPLTFNYVNGDTMQILRGSGNTGSVDMMGIELEGRLDLGAVDIDFAGSINDSDINDFTNATVTGFSGITDFSGNENPNTSKYSASAGVQYTGALNVDTDWYVRGDWTFKSGVWASAANIAKTPDLHLFKFRAGIETDSFSLSAFVDNAFNNKTPVSIDYGSVLVPSFAYSARSSRLLLGLPDLRTFGIEGKYRF